MSCASSIIDWQEFAKIFTNEYTGKLDSGVDINNRFIHKLTKGPFVINTAIWRPRSWCLSESYGTNCEPS